MIPLLGRTDYPYGILKKLNENGIKNKKPSSELKTAFNKIKYLKLSSKDNSDAVLKSDTLGRLQLSADVFRQGILMNQDGGGFVFYIRSGYIEVSFKIIGDTP